MSEYILTPRATSAPFEPIVVALVAATTKTALQVATPSTTDIRVLGWGVSFDGSSGSAVPLIANLFDGDVAATVTAMTPDLWGHSQAQASLCVGGTSASGYNASVEGTQVTAPRSLDPQHVHPQTGYGVWFPEGRQPRIAASRFLKIRCKAPAAVNVIPWVVWDEPAV